MSYSIQYQQSIQQPEKFWKQISEDIAWYKKPQTVLSQDDSGLYRWFEDGELNTSYLALDHHVENGRADQTALIYDSPVSGTKKQYTYAELTEQVARFAGALKTLDVDKGDRVIIYMPMIPEAVIAMLACARIGAVHCVVFGGFAAKELALRIDDAQPNVIISASCGIEVDRIIPYKPLLDSAIQQANCPPEHCIIFQREQLKAELSTPRDHNWNTLYRQAEPVDPVPLKSTDPLYILYTSGTTGQPKGVVRDNGGHAVAMKYSMKTVYDCNPGDVYWAGSDVGWVVGHSYIVYAPLITGCCTLLYEGKPVRTPDAGAYWRVIEEYKVNAFFVAPTAFRAIKKEDPDGELLKKYDISSLKNLFLAGERLDPPTYHWLKELLEIPVLDHWWQTETAWAIAANPIGIEPQTTKAGSATFPIPGFKVEILDDQGKVLDANKTGNIALKLPLPPGCLTTLWQNSQHFKQAYLSTYPGYYLTGDGGYIDHEGFLFIMGRTDDVINIAGHRLSTGEMEEIIASHSAVAECAVVGINDDLKGQIPIALTILKDRIDIDEGTLQQELVNMVREQIGPFACFKQSFIVKRLPKTRSGKILRKIIRSIANGEPYSTPPTIDDPAILDEINDAFSSAPALID
ncbi:MAG: propionyl-CoA synthetase [Moraxellaceae bacterium]|nr:MAG: propionyl-CoA synthetase [Moraxellaceae bacterium]